MMFWDSSALIPLILREASSASLTEQLTHEENITIWWGTPVECLSAIHRRHREAPLKDVETGSWEDPQYSSDHTNPRDPGTRWGCRCSL